jgi:hypothetical protein
MALASSASLLIAPSAALAAGGVTVETAPLLSAGQIVSGNTASDSVISQSLESIPSCVHNEELWTLSLTAGDQVLLQGREAAPASRMDVDALPPGVTDGQLLGTTKITGAQAGNLHEGLSFAAARSGTWLVIVGDDCEYGAPGPYELTATVTPPVFTAGPGGGTTVETAPLLSPSEIVSGNTASDTVISQSLESIPSCVHDEELWTLSLTAGDQVLLQGREEAPASRMDVEALPPGVTDAQLLGIANIAGAQAGNLHEGLSFAAARSGTWLVIVGDDCEYGAPGPYQLTATVTPPVFTAGPGGGTTVETAPLISSGQTVSGNTASDAVIAQSLEAGPVCMHDQELWRVNLSAGYHVLLQGREEAPASRFDIEAFPPGATDAQVLGIAKIEGAQDGNLHEGLSFAVARSGTWLLVVGDNCEYGAPGPYQLTVTGGSAPPRSSVGIVSHAVRGRMTTLVVHPSGAGTVTVAGIGIVTVRQKVGAATNVTLKLKLSKVGLASLRHHHHKLLVRLKVLFKPNYGLPSSATVFVTIR